MKIVYLSNNFIEGNGGGNFATRAFVNAFSEIANECILFYPDKGQNIKEFVSEKTILKGISNTNSNLVKLFKIYTGKINWYSTKVLSLIKTYNPDIVIFDGSRTSFGLIKKIKSQGKKVITVHHNYEIEYFKGTQPPFLWRIPFMFYMKIAERDSVILSDLNLTLTDQDLHLLQFHYDTQKVANIEKLGCFESDSTIFSYENIVDQNMLNLKNNLCFVLTGSLGSYQTEISVLPFLENEYPELIKRFPQSKLIIAGSNPSNKLTTICSSFPSIELIPNPENMQEVIDQADIYICPTCVGGGLKLRVMDGLKAGLPVLTHSVSARGYDDFIKAGILYVYYDKNSFITNLEKIVAGIHINKFNKKMIQELYISLFSFDAGVTRLKKILEDKQILNTNF